ncbi:hypothetical protein N7490_005329 [Penicillium lividum]|nr:hypothetical protein N7490_005329 [Penicillium lividum]
MLGRLELDVDECIEAYSELMESVFGEKISHIPVDWSLNIRAKFDSKRLKAAIEHVITQAGASPTDLMDDGVSRRTRAFVCTTARDTLQVTKLRSYSVPNEDTLPATILEAALATSAATRFFEPVTIGNRDFVDGAFGANNPVEEVEEEAADIWCTTSREIKPLVKCFLTVGTGCQAVLPMNDNILKFLSKTLVNLATKPESTERRFMARWSNEVKENRIFRFNVQQGLQTVRMDDCSQRSLIENATQDYLHHSSQKTRIHDCILNLATKKEKTVLEFDLTMREYEARIYKDKVLGVIQFSGEQSQEPSSPCWVVPIQRNSRFVDREYVSQIKRKLFLENEPQRIAVVGLGGVGKTQIALEVAYQTKTLYSDCAVFWIPAVDLESLHQAYEDIAYRLGLEFDPKKEDVKVVVQRHLTQSHSGRWLLIIDNADDLTMWTENNPDGQGAGLRGFLPASDRGVILFTTRSNKVARYLGATDLFHIAELDEQRATTVLRNFLLRKDLLDDTESTRQLLERLTYLPLAIVQAASFINENETDMANYVKLLDGQDQDVLDLLSEDFEDEGRYKSIRNPVATTWLTSQLSLAYVMPQRKGYTPSMVYRSTQLESQKAIGVLVSYSFVRTRNNGTRLDMHRLVHLATRNWLRSLNSFHEWMVHTLCQMSTYYPPELRERRAALPHALQVLDSTKDEPITEQRTLLLGFAAAVKSQESRFKDSTALYRQAIDSSNVAYGHDHPYTVWLHENLAINYHSQGEYQQSIRTFDGAIQVEEKARGSDSRQAIGLRFALSHSYRFIGDVEEAERLSETVLRYMLDHCSLDDPGLCHAISGMSLTYHAQGRLREAQELAHHIIAITKSSDTVDTDGGWEMFANTILADCYLDQWKLKDAEKLYIDRLETDRKIYGAEHRVFIRDMYKLAKILKAQMRHQESLAMMTECARLNAQICGPNHPATLECNRCVEKWTAGNMFSRLRQHIPSMERSAQMMDLRRRYPKAKAYGGLLTVRKRKIDYTMLNEVKLKLDAKFALSGASTDDTLLI